MPWKFNPFSGTLDQTGSGGGGSSYIDGEVQNFSALPETIGTPAVDSAYLVREAEGTWLLARKPAGIYIRTADTGVRANDWTHAGAFPDVFNDANFLLYDNADSTKNLAFQLSGLTPATTRTLTVPDASGTIARTEDFAAPPAIGNTTPAAGSFTTLNATGTTELVNGGTTAGPLNIYNTFTPTNNYERGFLKWDGSNFDIGTEKGSGGGAARNLRLRRDGSTFLNLESTSAQAFNSWVFFGTVFANGGITMTGSGNPLVLGASNHVIEQRSATNAQTFNIYNTFTNASNYERGFMRWSSNVLQIGTEAAGTGSNRSLELWVAGQARISFSTGGGLATFTSDIFVNRAGGFVQLNDGYLQIGSAREIRFGARSRITSPVNGQIRLTNEAENDFDRLQFGGTTNSFPALKRSATTLQARLADDTAFTAIQGKLTTEAAYTAGAPTPTGYLVIYDSNGTAYKVSAEAL